MDLIFVEKAFLRNNIRASQYCSKVTFRRDGGSICPLLALAHLPWEFCSDSEFKCFEIFNSWLVGCVSIA